MSDLPYQILTCCTCLHAQLFSILSILQCSHIFRIQFVSVLQMFCMFKFSNCLIFRASILWDLSYVHAFGFPGVRFEDFKNCWKLHMFPLFIFTFGMYKCSDAVRCSDFQWSDYQMFLVSSCSRITCFWKCLYFLTCIRIYISHESGISFFNLNYNSNTN